MGPVGEQSLRFVFYMMLIMGRITRLADGKLHLIFPANFLPLLKYIFMSDTIYCPKCGTANQADFMFCTSCGFALSTIGKSTTQNTVSEKTPPPYIAPVQNIPVAAASPDKTRKALPPWAAPVIVIVVLAGIGFLIWNNEKNKNSTGKETGMKDLQKDYDKKDKDNINDFTFQDTRVKARDFAGVWRPYESLTADDKGIKLGDPKDDLFIEYTNGRLNLYPREEQHGERSAEIECGEVIGNMITCQATTRNVEEQYSIKLELHPSKNEMTISITPASEGDGMVVKARRLNETGD